MTKVDYVVLAEMLKGEGNVVLPYNVLSGILEDVSRLYHAIDAVKKIEFMRETVTDKSSYDYAVKEILSDATREIEFPLDDCESFRLASEAQATYLDVMESAGLREDEWGECNEYGFMDNDQH